MSASNIELSALEVQRWRFSFREGVARRLKTPRNVAQFLNAVRFAMPILNGEVNAVDLMLVEALRVFYPIAYDVVRAHQGDFIGPAVGEIERKRGFKDQGDELLASVRSGLDARSAEALDSLLSDLFPRYQDAKLGVRSGFENVNRWNREKRVCSPAYGPRYFSFVVGTSDVSDTRVQEIAAAANSESRHLASLLDSELQPLKQVVLLMKIREYLGLSSQGAARLALAIAEQSRRFAEPFSLYSRDYPGLDAADLVCNLCEKIDEQKARIAIASKIIESAPDMWFAAAFTKMVLGPSDPIPGKSAFADEPAMALIKNQFAVRMLKFRQAGQPMLDLEKRWLFDMIFVWAKTAGRSVTHEYLVPPMRENGNRLIQLLKCMAQPVYRSGEIVPTPRDFGWEQFQRLDVIVDVDVMGPMVISEWIPKERQKSLDAWLTCSPIPDPCL